MRQVACCSRPPPFSTAPQSAYRGGQADLDGHATITPWSGPYSGVAPTIVGVTGWPRRQGMPGAPVPGGLCTLLVNHQVIPQPSTTSWRLVSSAWCLSEVCCSRHRVVYNASPQGRLGCLYTQGVSTFFHAAFTAHHDAGADALGRRLHCDVRRGPGELWCLPPDP